MLQVLHATSVAMAGRGLLILGASGSGKSGLALDLMCRGASLIADDRTIVTRRDDSLRLSCPSALCGLIEARHLGLLHAATVTDIPLNAILDMDQVETDRLPPIRTTRLMDVEIPLLHKSASPYFPAGLTQYLKAGRRETQ